MAHFYISCHTFWQLNACKKTKYHLSYITVKQQTKESFSFFNSNFSWKMHNMLKFQRFVLLGVRQVTQKGGRVKSSVGRKDDTVMNLAS
jgi:hypothetical protein